MAHPLAPSPADRGSDRPCVGPDRIHPATRDERRLPTAPIDLTAWLRIPGIAAGVESDVAFTRALINSARACDSEGPGFLRPCPRRGSPSGRRTTILIR